jgi:beta-lactamase regulating signal transducer with metallopeptidase domain
MNPLIHTISLMSATTAGALFSAIWEGAILAACVALCLRLIPRLSAAARSVVWTNVFLLLALLQVLPSFVEHWAPVNGISHSPFHLAPVWSVAIASIWAMLSLWRCVQLILSAIRIRRLARRATPIHLDAALQTLLDGQAADGLNGRSAELCSSTEVVRPSVFGFFRPRILLPPGLIEKLSALELQQVVLHEMEHLRRGDDWTNLLQKVGLVLFPLNPVLFWVERRLCVERELACDDRVLYSTGARKNYATCLTRLAEFSMLRRNFSLVLGAWERQSELVRRVHRILRRPHEQMSGRQAIILTGSLIVSFSAGAIVLARSPQLISFTPTAQTAALTLSLPSMDPNQGYRREFAGSPRLVKAVTPEGQPRIPFATNHRRITAAKQNVKRDQVLRNQQAWVVLTDWEGAEQNPRLVIAVSQDRRSSYAAVAIANGWLIVQI